MIPFMDNSGYEVRRVRADEWKQLREIRLEALKDTPIGFSERWEKARAKPDEVWIERAERGAGSAGTAIFVAVGEDDQFIGTAGVFTKSDDPDNKLMVIYGVYVTPAYRGSRRGVASLLFDSAIRWAREVAGGSVITLGVHEHNDRARAFYQRYGFVDTGGREPYDLDPTAQIITMRYEG
jgi:ribosomal protein S18 acetylase RimI-like enzyme